MRSLCLCFAIPAALSTGVLSADEIDDLLAPKKEEAPLVDNSATLAWNGVVDAFRRNDFAKAGELGDAFLRANYKTSPYQLLGVQVMLDLANQENPTVTRDAALTAEMKLLMSERDALRAKYANLQRIAQEADNRINKLTSNRTQAVQDGTAAYRECAAAARTMDEAYAAMEAMKPEIDANKVQVAKIEVGANKNLKSDTMKLLDMLVEADEIEAAFAIANVFIRVSGSDLEVAKKQQEVIRLREDQKKAEKLVAAISADVEPLIAAGKGEEAQTRLDTVIAKVEASDQSDSVKRMTGAKLNALRIRINSVNNGGKHAQAMSAAESAEITRRLEELEQKLEKAQLNFGTAIRSIDGFSDFSADFQSESNQQRITASLQEKVKAGAVSKEKMDNIIKAKSEHAGILSEVDILQSDPSKLTVVQKGRLANLRVTAQTATDLLSKATP